MLKREVLEGHFDVILGVGPKCENLCHCNEITRFSGFWRVRKSINLETISGRRNKCGLWSHFF